MPTDNRERWTKNDDGALVPRRTQGSVARGYSDADFALVCLHCGNDFSQPGETNLTLEQTVLRHYARSHAELLETGKVELEMLWLGQGPTPKAR